MCKVDLVTAKVTKVDLVTPKVTKVDLVAQLTQVDYRFGYT